MAQYDIGACGCCIPTVGCNICENDFAPEVFTLEISGIEDGSCNTCEGYNGPYEIGPHPFNQCAWALSITSPCPGGSGTISVQISYNAMTDTSTITVTVTIGLVINMGLIGVHTQPGRINCMALDSLDLTMTTRSSNHCDVSSAEMSLTSGAVP